jgi:hypothetical protein
VRHKNCDHAFEHEKVEMKEVEVEEELVDGGGLKIRSWLERFGLRKDENNEFFDVDDFAQDDEECGGRGGEMFRRNVIPSDRKKYSSSADVARRS